MTLINKPLAFGTHPDHDAMCIMEAAAYIAGEPWTDEPLCVCITLQRVCTSWNDSLPSDAERERWLRPLLPRLIGTNDPTKLEKRALICADFAARKFAPLSLDAENLKYEAEALRNFPAIVSVELAASILSVGAIWAAEFEDALSEFQAIPTLPTLTTFPTRLAEAAATFAAQESASASDLGVNTLLLELVNTLISA